MAAVSSGFLSALLTAVLSHAAVPYTEGARERAVAETVERFARVPISATSAEEMVELLHQLAAHYSKEA